MPTESPVKSHPTGLVAPTATAALAASRALTSHVRNFYLVCYEGRCRRPRLTFFIDMGLLAAAAILLASIIWIIRTPVAPARVALSLQAPIVQSVAPAPFVATIRSIDGATHHNVRIQWHLPPGAELLDARPSFSADGAYLGDVGPGREISSRVLIRFFLPPGDHASLTFSVFYDDFGIDRMYTAAQSLVVASSALTADIPDEFKNTAIGPRGTTVPLQITNATDRTMPSVSVSLLTDHEATDTPPRQLGDIAPGDTRFVYVPVQPHDGEATAHFHWTIGAASRDLVTGSWHPVVVTSTVSFPEIVGPLSARVDKPLRVPVTNAHNGDALIVVNPSLKTPVVRVSLPPGASAPDLSAPTFATGTNHEWLAVPETTTSNGQVVLGPATLGVTSLALPFTTQVRYLSSAGDQLGAGPNPPQAGIETRYWVFWAVGPVDNALKNIDVSADLAPGVVPTGNVSGPEGGLFKISGRHVHWTLGSLNETDGTTQPQAVFGFEIAVAPNASDVGNTLPLIGESAASAEDTQTSTIFEGSSDAETSALPEDVNQPNAGVVLPPPAETEQ